MEETFVLVLSQVIAMLTCLNNGGNFVIKLFTCDKPHSLSLFVLLAQLFEELILTKPVTSRPISGERFLTAFRLREVTTYHPLSPCCHTHTKQTKIHHEYLINWSLFYYDPYWTH